MSSMSQFSYLVENWPWLLLSATILTISIFATKLIRHRRFYADLPTPPHSLFWGNLKVMGETTKKYPAQSYFSVVFSEIAAKYSLDGIYYLDLYPFAEPFVLLLDPDLALQSQTSSNFTRHSLGIDFLGGLVGTESIFATHGKEWQQQRSWFAPAFSLTHLLTLVPGMIEETLVFRERLTQFAVSEKEFALNEELGRLTIDVIGRSVGDIKLNSQSGYSGIQHYFERAVDWAVGEGGPLWQRALKPFMVRWYIRNLDKLLGAVIKEKFSTNMLEGAEKSILGLARKGYLKHKASTEQKRSNQENIADNKEFMRIALDNAKTFFTAGFDTTSSTISYVYYLLSKHPKILSRVRAEHDEILGTTLESTISTLTNTPQSLNQLTLTNAVLKETLRLFPIGFTLRKATPGTTLAYKGRNYPVDNHSVVAFGPHMQRNSEFWENPMDFDPDRWVDADRDDKGKENGSWQPFERGPRNCIGQQLSLVEARVIAVLTLRWFDFEDRYKDDDESIAGWGGKAYQIFKLTAKPKDGIPVVVKLRNV